MSEPSQLPDDVQPVPRGLRPFRAAIVFSLVMLASTVAAAVWTCYQLPPGARVPMHWNAAGKIDGYGSRGSLFILPGAILFLTLLLTGLPFIEPRKFNLRASARAYNAVWMSVVGLEAVIQSVMIMTLFGWHVSMNRVAIGGTGVLFVILGNYLGKVRSNFFFGVRTPWTLSSELSWNKTHRLAGRLFVLAGVAAVLAAALLAASQVLVFVLIGLLTVAAAIPIIYSYFVWRTDPHKTPIGRAMR